MAPRTRVLIVDDSRTMRRIIGAKLEADPRLEIVGEAGDAFAARSAIKDLNPDVMTLDVEMPKMDGVDFLAKVMRLRPMPVVMISSHTRKGADAAIRALSLGAVDCVGKPSGSGCAEDLRFNDLAGIVFAAASANVRQLTDTPMTPRLTPPPRPLADAPLYNGGNIIAIGASTGGVEALFQVIQGLPQDCPPGVIVQHMPQGFLPSFAAHLDKAGGPRVVVAEDGAPLRKGVFHIAPGGTKHMVLSSAQPLRCRLVEGPPVNGHTPSVDTLLHSAAPYANKMICAIMTGIGRDGAAGLKALHSKGARTIAQDEPTSVVYGMPKAAKALGAVDREVPLSRISTAIMKMHAEKQTR